MIKYNELCIKIVRETGNHTIYGLKVNDGLYTSVQKTDLENLVHKLGKLDIYFHADLPMDLKCRIAKSRVEFQPNH